MHIIYNIHQSRLKREAMEPWEDNNGMTMTDKVTTK